MNRFIYTVLIILSLPFALLRILLRDAKNSNWIRKLKNQLGFVPKIKKINIYKKKKKKNHDCDNHHNHNNIITMIKS